MMKIKDSDLSKTPIIFYDGVCSMCNNFVDIILNADKKKVFRFAPLQGDTAKELLSSIPNNPKNWSMVYLDEHGAHKESDASLEIYRRLGGSWWLLSIFRFVPKTVRDPIYRFIAENRYKFFGKKESCHIPLPEDKDRFLP